MKQQRLEQYISLKREIAMLEEQIDAAELVFDSVKGSRTEVPYTVRGIVIQGYATGRACGLRRRKRALEAECAAIEAYVENVADSAMRQLLTRRYLEGKSLADAARLVGYSERQAKRLYKNFFKKMSPNVP